MDNTAESWRYIPSGTGTPLSELSRLRFVVGVFDSWPQLRQGVRDARARGLVLEDVNCIAFERVLRGHAIGDKPLILEELAYRASPELIVCTRGPLANHLREQLRSGAGSLKQALGRWLIPRHAAHFAEAVQAGRILLWLRVANDDDERRAYQCLLAQSSNSVGVHDLPPPDSR